MKEKIRPITSGARKYLSTYNLRGGVVEKGRVGESRALGILRELTEAGFILGASRASKKQDKKGIDLFVQVNIEGEVQKVPIQVKRSFKGAEEHKRLTGENPARGQAVIMIVNDNKSDEQIKFEFRRNMGEHLGMIAKSDSAGMADLPAGRQGWS